MHRSIANACFRSFARPIMTQPTLACPLHTKSKTHFSYGMSFPSSLNTTKRHTTTTTHAVSPEYPMDEIMEEAIITLEPSVAEDILQLSPTSYIEFDCTICHEKIAQTFNKSPKGVVIIRCSGCQNLHLIADNYGFNGFSERGVEDVVGSRTESLISKWESMDYHVKK